MVLFIWRFWEYICTKCGHNIQYCQKKLKYRIIKKGEKQGQKKKMLIKNVALDFSVESKYEVLKNIARFWPEDVAWWKFSFYSLSSGNH